MVQKTHKTMRGSMISMEQLRLKNEKTIALGNMNINAGGDTVGPGGKIIKTKTQRSIDEKELHTMTPGKIPVSTGHEQVDRKAAIAEVISTRAQADKEDREAAEKILADAEAVDPNEPASERRATPRTEVPKGGLAATMKATAEVTCELTETKPDKKKKGVKRI